MTTGMFSAGTRVEVEDCENVGRYIPATIVRAEDWPGRPINDYYRPGYIVQYGDGRKVWVDEYDIRKVGTPAPSIPVLAPGTIVRIAGPDALYRVDLLETSELSAVLTFVAVGAQDFAWIEER